MSSNRWLLVILSFEMSHYLDLLMTVDILCGNSLGSLQEKLSYNQITKNNLNKVYLWYHLTIIHYFYVHIINKRNDGWTGTCVMYSQRSWVFQIVSSYFSGIIWFDESDSVIFLDQRLFLSSFYLDKQNWRFRLQYLFGLYFCETVLKFTVALQNTAWLSLFV